MVDTNECNSKSALGMLYAKVHIYKYIAIQHFYFLGRTT